MKIPHLELKHLEQLSGYTEIRKANANELVEHSQSRVNSVEEAKSWQKWALQNIPGLSPVEIDMINSLVETNNR